MRALADAGLALRRLKARQYFGALQIGHLQLGAGVHQQFDVGIQITAAVTCADHGCIGMGGQERAKAQQQGEEDGVHQDLPGSIRGSGGASIAGDESAARACRQGR